MNKSILLLMIALISVSLFNFCSKSTTKPETNINCVKKLTKRGRPDIASKTISEGKGIPNSTIFYRVKNSKFNITGYSSDPEYGYSLKKPIFTGGNFDSGSARQWLFLIQLRDYKNRPIYFERLGSAGYYKDPEGKKSGIVDAYIIKVKDIKNPLVLYLSLYAPSDSPIQIPMCFSHLKLNN